MKFLTPWSSSYTSTIFLSFFRIIVCFLITKGSTIFQLISVVKLLERQTLIKYLKYAINSQSKPIIKTLAATSKVEKLTKLNLGQFKKFQHHQKLKQAALTCIAVQANPNDIRELKNIFQSLDVNGDGSLTLEELKNGL